MSGSLASVLTFESRCKGCHEPVALRPVQTQSDMEVIELIGCDYAGFDLAGSPTEIVEEELPNDSQSTPDLLRDWISQSSDSGGKTRLDVDPLGGEETFFDGLIAQWRVRLRNGEEFTFQYFSEVRKWIQEGKVRAGDQIIPADGRTYRIESYPGTADLFGNPFARTEARFGMQASSRSRPVPRRNFKFLKRLAGAVAVAAAVAGAPSAYHLWQIHQGRALVEQLVENVGPVSSDHLVSALLNAKDLLRQNTPELFPRATHEFLKALAIRPEDPEILAGLAETWIETATLTSDREDLRKAKGIINFAKAIAPESALVARAEARFLWRTGNPKKALELLEQRLSSEAGDPDTHALLAKIALDQNDFVAATLHFDHALQADPTNPAYLESFVELFEKQDKFAKAAEYLKRAEALAMDKSPYTDRLARLYEKVRDFDSAETVRRRAIARRENLETNRLALIQLLAKQKRNQDVINESLTFFSQHPNGDHYPEVRGMYEAALNQVAAAPVGGDSSSKTNSTKSSVRRSHRSSRR
ncbi:MAG TPA: tetratricopeptide repeat protein [Bdellovibrionota bacterium]|nr:tetratricopeptide repeat protein [Bdellovibrionota bacterium]